MTESIQSSNLFGKMDMVDVSAMATLLGVVPSTVWRAVGRKELPEPVRLMGKSYFLMNQVQDHLKTRFQTKLEKQQQNRRVVSRA